MACVALLASGCSYLNQKDAQDAVTQGDTTACHRFGPWDAAAHKNQITAQTTTKMFSAMSHASDRTLKKDTTALLEDFQSENVSAADKQIVNIAQRCNYLGLIDANGNPTENT